jgi:gamma-glutamyl hercynylcysteine S-oxide hydrolase
MCRHLGYLGAPVSLAALLLDPPHSLARQAWEPRHLDVGRINADGWGVGWYDSTVGPEPARYRTATPIWADHAFAGIAGHLRADHVLAAVRNASPGLPVEASGAAPFVADRYLFSHNGSVEGWHDGVGLKLRRGLSERREALVGGRSDSEVLLAMILDRVDAGAPVGEAVAGVIDEVALLAGGRFNLLLSDGSTITATRHGCSLFVRSGDDHVIAASEPLDDGDGWYPVPERSLVTLTAGSVSIAPL